jgi:hypothetical protein
MPELDPIFPSGLGFALHPLELPAEVREAVESRDWPALDARMRRETVPGGAVFEALRLYARFSEIEFIIAIRSSEREPDEDGIWHDDGSRVLAFSLSLTLAPERIEGGKLEIRKRFSPGAQSAVIPTPPFGTMIVFATGVSGFEHKINRVARGERVIVAGWCT